MVIPRRAPEKVDDQQLFQKPTLNKSMLKPSMLTKSMIKKSDDVGKTQKEQVSETVMQHGDGNDRP